jgi:putative nucleotidyltransferase with HDIG domain
MNRPDPSDNFTEPTGGIVSPANAAALRPTQRSERWNAVVHSQDLDAVELANLRQQVQALTQQLEEERQVTQKLLALNDFGREFPGTPNPERSAQSMARLLARLAPCELVCIFSYHAEEQRFKLLAAYGSMANQITNQFTQNSSVDAALQILQRTTQTRRVICGCELADCPDSWHIGGAKFPSIMAAPLVSAPLGRGGVVRGAILLAGSAKSAFLQATVPVLETAAAQLLHTWEAAEQNEALTDFVQAISMMSVVQEVGSLLEMTATIARQTLDAQFVVVASLNQQEWIMRSAGQAPTLARSLRNGGASFLENALQSPYTFRLRDVRQDERAACLAVDSADLCALLASPIRINGAPTGILLAFGKIGADRFTETDVFLIELLLSQAAVNLESCFLNDELRSSLKTTQLLYDLSLSISQSETLKDAARAIARTAYRLLQARKCGLILFAPDGRPEAEVRFPGDDPTIAHPFPLIQKAMDSRQTIYLSENEALSEVAIPIQTMRRCYGALWLEVSEDLEESRHPTEEIRILVNQAAVALERSILLEETRNQANEITRSYQRLEGAYEGLLYGLTKALDARDGETERHSSRVEELSVRLGALMSLGRSDLQALKRGALLHDIGKIGVPDTILRKHGPLEADEWQEMRKHPQKGAQMIQEIPALQDALPVIAFHHERWDGSGYPLQIRGTDIPLLARIFAVVDVYDALTTDRPYRKALPVDEALAYLETQAGIQFDPEIVTRFTRMVRSGAVEPAGCSA